MPAETLDRFLDRVAAGTPAPGGGAAAAVQAALAAALVGMVARCTPYERFPTDVDDTTEIARAADACRARCLAIAAEDEAVFAQVAGAYRLPHEDEEQRGDRSASIQAALEGASAPPIALIEQAERILRLAERLLPIANPNARADLAGAAEGARAACAAARLTVEANLQGLRDPVAPTRLRSRMGDVDGTLERARRLSDAIRVAVTSA